MQMQNFWFHFGPHLIPGDQDLIKFKLRYVRHLWCKLNLSGPVVLEKKYPLLYLDKGCEPSFEQI
jgi:hypothetical protein